jgi:hypothetical protein
VGTHEHNRSFVAKTIFDIQVAQKRFLVFKIQVAHKNDGAGGAGLPR